MRLVGKRGVLEKEHHRARRLPDWDNARVFLEVVRCGSFRPGRRAPQPVHQCRAPPDQRIRARDRRGAVHARRPRHRIDRRRRAGRRCGRAYGGGELRHPAQRAGCATPTIAGEVRVAVTEGIGTFWLAPRLVEFQRAFPNILVDLHCAMRSADVLRHEADVAIQLVRPTALDVKAVKIGRLHVMWYASQSYIELYGKPTTLRGTAQASPRDAVADQTQPRRRSRNGSRACATRTFW